ncbi:MAG TPA: Rne/Rng family ribonuclease, partial [Gammaproteobacteria bacterium]|nr:Rne/Rng family ribonuclease [Gammaproteobacteria bacterium]
YFVREPEEGSRVNIKDVLKEGQEIVVQVDKEERGTKGAALTTFVSLAGRFLVLMPNNPRAGGVSRRITGEDRDVVREALEELEAPEGMGCIVRTAGVGRSPEELRWDLDYLMSVWEAIKAVVVTRPAPFLIYQEGNAIVRAIRDHLSNDIGEILVDDQDIHDQAREFMERVMPHNLRKLKLYDDDTVPLFTRFQIESQIESAYTHSVSLPSGGGIVIDPTEALTSIDINSARATKGEDIEETALNTNLEAADEIARQLRIRDVGGLIVIDFIDMGPQKNQREVENRLRDAVKQDRARIQIGRISRFGLLEMSRQRLRPSLGEATQSICPRCNGLGNIRSIESMALAVLRLVGEEARKERTAKVISQLPVDLCNFILNEKRGWVQAIQDSNDVSIVLVANPDLETPNYKIKRVRDDEVELPENRASSYRMAEPKEDPGLAYEQPAKTSTVAEQPAVAGVVPPTPAPPPPPEHSERAPPRERDRVSLWQRLFGWLRPAATEEASTSHARPRRSRSRTGGNRGERGRGASERNERGAAPRDRQPSPGQGQRSRPSGKKGARGNREPGADGGSGSRGRRSRRRGRGGEQRSNANTPSQDRPS